MATIRAEVMLFLIDGWTRQDMIKVFNYHENTVDQWRKIYVQAQETKKAKIRERFKEKM